MRPGRLTGLICFLVALIGFSAPASAMLNTQAEHAVLMDAATGKILWDKNGDVSFPPASMSKLMTLDLLFQQLKDGRVKLTDKFLVSTKAWQTGGSKMFVKVGTSIPVEDLIRGIIIDSGNDACVVVAQALGGNVRISVRETQTTAVSQIAPPAATFTGTITFDGATVTRSSGSFLADGFLPNTTLVIGGGTPYDGEYTITGVTDTTITLSASLWATADTRSGVTLTGQGIGGSSGRVVIPPGGNYTTLFAGAGTYQFGIFGTSFAGTVHST